MRNRTGVYLLWLAAQVALAHFGVGPARGQFAGAETGSPRRAEAPTFQPPRTQFQRQPQSHAQSAPSFATGAGSAPQGADSAPIPLAPPESKQGSSRSGGKAPTFLPNNTKTVVVALGIVLGLFFLVVWFSKKSNPTAPRKLPPEAVEFLGFAVLAPKQQLQLVRIGSKLLLLAVTQHGASTLTEISRAEEVERLLAVCQRNQPGSISAAFRQVLAQAEEQPASRDFLAPPEAQATASPRATVTRQTTPRPDGANNTR